MLAANEPAPGNETKVRVLVVEDDKHARRTLYAMLALRGYEPIEASSGAEALRRFSAHAPHVVLLDLGLGDIDGVEVAAQIREAGGVPVIVISARADEAAQIAALDSGANDYVTKPYREGELLARIRAVLRLAARHGGPERDDVLTINGLSINRAERAVSVGDTSVALTPTEYRLLEFMVDHAGVVVTHRQLLREVWGEAYATEVEYLRVYMQRLRTKLEGKSGRPRHFVTVPRVGYLFLAQRT